MLQLYPSARLGAFYRSYPTHQHFLRCSVLYRVVATITATGSPPKIPCSQWQCVREIFITPTRSPDPPLYHDTYSKEYRVNDCVTLRRHFCGHSLAQLHISAQEPPPINLSDRKPRASTFVPMELSLIPSIHLSSYMPFHNWTIAVKASLRLRVFHSSKRLETEPMVEDPRKLNHLFMRVEPINEEVRHYDGLYWNIDPLGSHLSWRTKLHIAVSVPKWLLPSFMGPNAALRYNMVLKISILGLGKASASVVVPVQLYRSHLPSSVGNREGQQLGTSDNSSDDFSNTPQELDLDSEEVFVECLEHGQQNPPEYRFNI
jgi:hypothetical protein